MNDAVGVPGPNWLAKVVASGAFFVAGGIVALGGSLAGMASAIAGIALLTWGVTSLMASLIVWTHGGHATAGRVLAAFAIASAAVSGLLGFTEGGEIAFGASALFVFAALGSALDLRAGDIPGRYASAASPTSSSRLRFDGMDMLDAHQQVEYRRRAMPIVPRLLKAMPTMKDRWVAYLRYWDGRSEGDYLDMSEFAQHLVEKLRAGETSEFPTLFQAVEDLYRQDDDVIDEVLTVGLLEDIQNVAANTGVQSSRFRQWLGPITTNRWELLHRDWGTTDT